MTKQQKQFHVADLHLQVPFNDADALNAAFNQHAREIAGVIIEPVQARNGLVADEEFLKLARQLCDRHGALLIFDEIKTGFGRTGQDFFYQWSGVVPDIMMLAKGLSGGICGVGALVYNDKVYKKVFHDVEQLGVYSSTFRENNVAMAVGLAVMHLMQHESCLENVRAAEALIRKRLDGAPLSNGDSIQVRGRGLQLSVTLEGRKKRVLQSIVDTVEKDLFYTNACNRLLIERHVLAMIPNRFGAAIAVIPALNIPLDLVEEFCDAVLAVFDELSSQSNVSVLKSTVKSARQLL